MAPSPLAASGERYAGVPASQPVVVRRESLGSAARAMPKSSTLTTSPIASERLELLPDGRVRYRFKRVWRDGPVPVEFDPIDFVGKLAALVPRPRSNLVRYHGCLAPHASIRAYVVNDGRGPPPSKAEVAAIAAARCSMRVESRAPLSCASSRARRCAAGGLRWPELMQRVFAIDVLLCPSCGGRMKPIAEITDKRVAKKMLEHAGSTGEATGEVSRANPARRVRLHWT